MITSDVVQDHAQLDTILAGVAVKEEAVYIKEELPADQNEIFVQQDGVKDEFIAVKSETDFLQCFGDVHFALGGASAGVESMFLTNLSEDDFLDAPGNGHVLGPGSPEGGVGLKLEPPEGGEMLGLVPPEGGEMLGPGPPEGGETLIEASEGGVGPGPPEGGVNTASRCDVDAAVHVKTEPPCCWSFDSTGSTLRPEAQTPFCEGRKVRRKLKHSDAPWLSVSANQQEPVSANQQGSISANQQGSVSANQQESVSADRLEPVSANQHGSVSANQQEPVPSNQQEYVSANQQDSSRNPCAHGDDAARVVEWEGCVKEELVDDPPVMPHSEEFMSSQSVDSSEPNLVPKYSATNINYNHQNGNLISDEPHLAPKYGTTNKNLALQIGSLIFNETHLEPKYGVTNTNFTPQNGSLISDGSHSIKEITAQRRSSRIPKSNMNTSNARYKRPVTQPDHAQASKQPKLPRRGSYQCKLCSFSCNCVSTFLTHSKNHKKERPTHLFECRACDFSCSDMKVFLAHTTDVCKVVSKNPVSFVRTKGAPPFVQTKSTPSSDGTKSTPSSDGTKGTTYFVQTKGTSDGKAVLLPPRDAKNQVFCCEYCDFETHNGGFILRHVALHVKEARRSDGFECSSCDYKCGDRDQFLLHVEAHNSLKLRATGDTSSLDPPRLSLNTELGGETTFMSREKYLSITKEKKFKLGNSRMRVGSVRTMASTGIDYGGNSTERVTMATESASDCVTMATSNASDLVTMATGSGAVTNSIVNIRQQGKMGVVVGRGVNEMLLKSSVRDVNHRPVHSRNSTTCTPRGAHVHDHSRVGAYACNKCPYTCTSVRTFRVHLAQCGRPQKQARDTDDFLQCSRCSFKTRDTKWFLGHVQGH